MKITQLIDQLSTILEDSGDLECFVSSWEEDGDCGASLENPLVSTEETKDGSAVLIIHTANNP